MFDHKIPDMKLEPGATALVFTDLHNDFLAPEGKAYPLLKESLARNGTAENIERLFRAAHAAGHESVRVSALLLSPRPRVGSAGNTT